MKLRRTLITAIIAVFAATLAATGSASRVMGITPTDKIAYTNLDKRDAGFDVMLASIDGKNVANITHDGTARKYVDPNWSANGMKVAYTGYYANGGADIYVVNANGKGAVNITGRSVHPGVLNIHPTWAPDGSIVFASNRAGHFELYRIGIAATNRLVRMTKTAAPIQNLDPDYSADGKMLVFSRVMTSVTPGLASLYTMRAVPYASATKLTPPTMRLGERGASWSPNGRQIAFYTDRGVNSELFVINRDGSGLRQLTFNKTADREPSWSPDGSTLVFLSDRSTYTELWMTSLVGMSPGPPVAWQVTFDKQLKGAPDWQPATPVPGS
jgi:Tol biopolymer transport system component